MNPTPEQIEAIKEALSSKAYFGTMGPASLERSARVLWPIIRDMVLEAAAKQIKADFTSSGLPWPQFYCTYFVECLRALKGQS